ncbi:CBY1-interacting BAR domain-containing protein 1-A-like [Paramacrobiotus metropolitanus]|uniref:CBY1-interacting BAR domain-containing protein 1-A-like n=1 Tax=Paramacrobiotus metropolitanus TaxID=2943436 RepID=UPI002445772E|nr:CBY1-interacting BAR domain-containing protein 1-A-like [Paramacrobiotus metropolitanus]
MGVVEDDTTTGGRHPQSLQMSTIDFDAIQPVLPTGYDPTIVDMQSKQILRHAEITYEFFGRYCKGFASYARKLARLRDKGDELARCIVFCSETQPHSPSTKSLLNEFSTVITSVQDRLNGSLLRLESHVVPGFSKFGMMAHSVKQDGQKSIALRQKEARLAMELQQMQNATKAETTVQQRHQKAEAVAHAATDARLAHEQLLEQADKFEKQKLTDLRQLLMNFLQIELGFHAKALKLYTQAYNQIKRLNMADDIESFRAQMRILQGSMSAGPDPNLLLEHPEVAARIVSDSSSGCEISKKTGFPLNGQEIITRSPIAKISSEISEDRPPCSENQSSSSEDSSA